MPDLSNLLGAVYGDEPSSTQRDPEDEAHVEHEPAADERGSLVPDWADDEHLDAAFAQWKPGPSDDAAPAEHAFVKDTGDDDDPPPPLADDLAAALSEALVASSGSADDSDDYGFKPAKLVDFSDPGEIHGDEQPVEHEHPVDHDVADHATVDHDVAEHDVVEHDVVVTDAHDDDDHEDDTDENPHEEQDHLRHLPAITPQRAAAAELTAASRVEPDAVEAPMAADPVPPTPAAVPPPATPVAATPTPTAADPTAQVPSVPVPVGSRRWERGDDDILPERQAKKFFSLSVRRG